MAKHCAPWLTFKGEFVTAPLVRCSLHLLPAFLSAAMHHIEWSYFAVDGQVCKFTFILSVLRNRSRGVTIHKLVLGVVLLGVLCHALCACVGVLTLLSAACG